MSKSRPTPNDKSSRIVFGYTRIHCETHVPAPLVEIIRKFYNLWIHRWLSKDEISTVQALKEDDTVAFTLPNANFMLNGSEFDCYLQVRCCYKFAELVCYELLLKAALPGDIEFISCLVKTNDPLYIWRRWTRVHTRDGEIYGNSGLYHLAVINLGPIKPRWHYRRLSDAISIHVDIKQIKYTPEAQQQDIDSWKLAKKDKWMRARGGLTLEALGKGRTSYWNLMSRDEQRDFVCEHTQINSEWNNALFRIQERMLALPINVSALNMKVVARGNVEGMYFEISTIMFLNGKRTRKRPDLPWNRIWLANLQIDMEIVKVFDLHEQEINDRDWSKYGVSGSRHEPFIFKVCEDYCCSGSF